MIDLSLAFLDFFLFATDLIIVFNSKSKWTRVLFILAAICWLIAGIFNVATFILQMNS